MLERSNGTSCEVQFRYEDLPTFSFICDLLGHSERFCNRLFTVPKDQITKPYGLFMKAASRRRNHTIGDRWLQNEGGTAWRPADHNLVADVREYAMPEMESQRNDVNNNLMQKYK